MLYALVFKISPVVILLPLEKKLLQVRMPLLLVIVHPDSVVAGHDNVSNGTSADIFGINRTNSTSNSLLLGNGSYTNIRANSTCDLGTSSIPFQNIFSNSSLIGPVNSRTVDNITVTQVQEH